MQLVNILWFGLLITPQALALNTCEGQSFGYKITNPEKPESYFLCLGFMGLKLDQNCNDGFRFSQQLQTCVDKDKSTKEPTENVTPEKPIFFNIFGYFWPSSQSTEVKKPENSSVKVISQSALLLNSELSENESEPLNDDTTEASEEQGSTLSTDNTSDDFSYFYSGDGPTSEEPSLSTVTDSIQDTSTENDVIVSDEPSSEEPLPEDSFIQLSQDIFANSNEHFQEINISSSEEPSQDTSTEENISSSEEPSSSDVTEPSQEPSSEEPLPENPFIELSQDILENSNEGPPQETSTEENISSSGEPSSSDVTEASQEPSSEEPLPENPFVELSQEIFENSNEEPSQESSTEQNISSSEEPSSSDVTEPSQEPSSEELLPENPFVGLSQDIFENSNEEPPQETSTGENISSSEEPSSSDVTEPSQEPLPDNVFIQLSQDTFVNYDEPSENTFDEVNFSSSEESSQDTSERGHDISSLEPLKNYPISSHFTKESPISKGENLILSPLLSELSPTKSIEEEHSNSKKQLGLHVISGHEKLTLCSFLPDGTFLRDLRSCNKFFVCANSRIFAGHCPDELYFDIDNRVCNFPSLVECKIDERHISHPLNKILSLEASSIAERDANEDVTSNEKASLPSELISEVLLNTSNSEPVSAPNEESSAEVNIPKEFESSSVSPSETYPTTEEPSLDNTSTEESIPSPEEPAPEKPSTPLPQEPSSRPPKEPSPEGKPTSAPEEPPTPPSKEPSPGGKPTRPPKEPSPEGQSTPAPEKPLSPPPKEPAPEGKPTPAPEEPPKEPSPEGKPTPAPEESSTPPPKEPSPGGKPTRPPKEPSPEGQSTPAPEKPLSPPPKEPAPEGKPTPAPEEPPKEPSPEGKPTPAPEESSTPPPKEPSPGGKPTRPPKEPSPEGQSTPAPEKPSSPPPKEPAPEGKPTHAPEESSTPPPKEPSPGGKPTRPPKEPSPEGQSTPAPEKPLSPPPKEPAPEGKPTPAPEEPPKEPSPEGKPTPAPEESSTPPPKKPSPGGKPTRPPKEPSPGRKTTPFPKDQPYEKPSTPASEELPRTDCTLLQNGVFLRDPQLCGKYYVCINGKAIPQHCRNGLYFDIKKKVCNFPSLVDCSNGIEEAETDAHVLKIKKGSITLESSPKKPTRVESLSSFAVAEEIGSSSQEGTDCTYLENGIFLRDPQLCGKFYVCSNGKAIPQHCPDFLHFDLKKNVCNHPSLVDCSNDNARSKVPDCGDLPNGAHIRDDQSCSKIYICANGVPIARQCPHGLNFDIIQGYCNIPSLVNCSIKNSIEANSLQTERDLPDCSGKEDGTSIRDSKMCNKYFICRNGQPKIHYCTSGNWFDIDRQICANKRSVECNIEM
ncbi:uncharacterized protein Dwil_GK12379 [Drosophila willistoni]|uniref:Chitin-binding type-2 domain-containing protein n=1 Tax=Drosophila willistoni TaxID=7260 RepID=A0A0Q9WZI5_DROWI|nr:msx2-interacting protein [Drosophila willistoni]KRF99006.1 uncharacterized protein Dwil_GK12379 [Drosophila willistoni]